MTSHPRATRCAGLVTLFAAALVAACASVDGPAAPAGLACPGAQVRLCTSPEYAAQVRAAVADAADRLAPALENSALRTALTDRMAILSVQLDAGEVGDARQTLRAIQAALTTARADARAAAAANDAADLDAIAIAIQETAAALADL